MSWHPLAKALIGVGACLVVAGLGWQVFGRHLPLGRLPGDIAVERESFRFYFPLGTSVLLSVILSLIVYVISFFRNR